jgi:hypothetical protein
MEPEVGQAPPPQILDVQANVPGQLQIVAEEFPQPQPVEVPSIIVPPVQLPPVTVELAPAPELQQSIFQVPQQPLLEEVLEFPPAPPALLAPITVPEVVVEPP